MTEPMSADKNANAERQPIVMHVAQYVPAEPQPIVMHIESPGDDLRDYLRAAMAVMDGSALDAEGVAAVRRQIGLALAIVEAHFVSRERRHS